MPDAMPLRIGESLRVLIVAGIPVGVLVAGLGSRLAMFVLRLTSDESVIGATSDDDFEIGRVTFGGTINLLVLGSVAGLFGAALYQWVRPWLIGPHWFGLLTVGLAVGAVVGSMLVHADGVDFVVLTPTWLAVTLFVLLPALFGICIGLAVDRVERPTSWTARGRTRWLLPVLLVLPFPPAWFIVAVRRVRAGDLAVGARPSVRPRVEGERLVRSDHPGAVARRRGARPVRPHR